MRKGVVTAAKAIDDKFIHQYGEAEFIDCGPVRGLKFHPSSPYRTALITLTYRPAVDWDPKHISLLINHYRNWFKRTHAVVLHYVWTVELQGNGKPHYHIVMWFPRGVKPPLPDDQGWWPHGMTNAVYARSPVGYIAKYASKSDGQSAHHLPKKARLWGYGGLSLDERAPVFYALAPRWLRLIVLPWSGPRKRTLEFREPTADKTLPRLNDGTIFCRVRRFSAWVLSCSGQMAGYAFIGPYEYDGFDDSLKSMQITHRGFIELLTPEDNYTTPFIIHHRES